MDDQPDSFEDAPLLINDCDDLTDEFHCHTNLTHQEDKKAWKKLMVASILCFAFMLTELIGGFIAGSLAVMTDAAHLFSDLVGFLISLLSIWIAKKRPTICMSFGYHRAEVLGALLSVVMIWLLAGVFIVFALHRIWENDYYINADTMIIISLIGLIVNLGMGGIFCGFCHDHNHGLSNPVHMNHSNSNINVRAAAAHVLGDLLQSCGVLVAAIIIKIFPKAKLADPLCTLIFSVLVVCTTASVAKDSIWMLMEGSPSHTKDLQVELKNLTGVRHVHNLHIWALSPGRNVASVHLSIEKYSDRDIILRKATSIIRSKFEVISCTVQIEIYLPDVITSCQHCQSIPC